MLEGQTAQGTPQPILSRRARPWLHRRGRLRPQSGLVATVLRREGEIREGVFVRVQEVVEPCGIDNVPGIAGHEKGEAREQRKIREIRIKPGEVEVGDGGDGQAPQGERQAVDEGCETLERLLRLVAWTAPRPVAGVGGGDFEGQLLDAVQARQGGNHIAQMAEHHVELDGP